MLNPFETAIVKVALNAKSVAIDLEKEYGFNKSIAMLQDSHDSTLDAEMERACHYVMEELKTLYIQKFFLGTMYGIALCSAPSCEANRELVMKADKKFTIR